MQDGGAVGELADGAAWHLHAEGVGGAAGAGFDGGGVGLAIEREGDGLARFGVGGSGQGDGLVLLGRIDDAVAVCIGRDGVECEGGRHGVDDEFARADVAAAAGAATGGDADADVVSAVLQGEVDDVAVAFGRSGGVQCPGFGDGVVADTGVAGAVTGGAVDGGGDGHPIEGEGEDITVGQRNRVVAAVQLLRGAGDSGRVGAR